MIFVSRQETGKRFVVLFSPFSGPFETFLGKIFTMFPYEFLAVDFSLKLEYHIFIGKGCNFRNSFDFYFIHIS